MAIFKYRVSDDYVYSSMMTPVDVNADNQQEAERKINELWGYQPQYSKLVSIKEQ